MTDLLPPPPSSEPSSAADEPTTVVAAVDAPSVEPERRGVGQSEVASTGLAVAVAIVVGATAKILLGVDNPILLVVFAYAAFLVVTVAGGGELSRFRAGLPDADGRTDPTTGERAPGAGAVGGGPTAGFVRPVDVDLTAPEGREQVRAIPGVIDDDPDHDEPRVVRTLTEGDAWEAVAAVAGALATAITLKVVLDWSGLMSTVVMAYLVFLILYFALMWDQRGQEIAGDRIVTVLVWTAGFLVLGGLTWMLGLLLIKGLPRLRPSFFTEDLSTVGPNDPGGGALHAIIGTLEQVGIATVIVVPLAVLTAVYLNELRGRMSPVIRFVVDAMTGLPSIVAGLLIFTVWVDGRGFSGVAGAAALVILMLPTVTRTSEEILKTIPDSLREASLALGAPQWRVVLRVVVPTALTGLVTAIILGVARAIGETAPMLLTAFGSDSVVTNPTAGPQSDLPLFVWKLIRVPNEVQQQRAWTGLLVLVMLVLFLFITARVLANRANKRLGRAR